jgi:hypothetical protein
MRFKHAGCAVWSGLLTLAWTTQAGAYRPFDGTDAAVAAPREVELELGPLAYAREGQAQFLVGPAFVLNYGVAPGLESVLEGRQRRSVGRLRDSELDEVALSLKSLLRDGALQEARGVSVALETGLLLPGSERRLGASVASIFSWHWPGLTLHLNLGNELLTSVHYAARCSAILEGPLAWRVRPVTELLLARDFRSRKLSNGLERSVLLGAIASWSGSWAFDLAFRHGLLDSEAVDEVRLGFTWSFSTL